MINIIFSKCKKDEFCFKTEDMIKVEQAIQIIQESISSLGAEFIETCNAVGRISAEHVYSPLSFPPFDQSAMDGYAVNNKELTGEFKVVYELKAGDDATGIILNPGEACRIFTGAMLPTNTLAVIRQEDVIVNGEFIKCNAVFKNGENVRICGEQINEGDIAISKNQLLNPGIIGFLLMLGVEKIKVYKKPRIKIIATGSELVAVGHKLTSGKIFESNTGTLKAALNSFGFEVDCQVVEDVYESIKVTIDEAISSADLVLVTGGISVGDYDFVSKVMLDLKVEQKFYKVKQKPGKPIYFGLKDDTVIFGLPGNPAAVLTSFYVYILEALRALTGRSEPYLIKKKARLLRGMEKSYDLTVFLKGRLNIDTNDVNILPAQSSAMLSSFVEANCLIQLKEGVENCVKNSEVEIILLPS